MPVVAASLLLSVCPFTSKPDYCVRVERGALLRCTEGKGQAMARFTRDPEKKAQRAAAAEVARQERERARLEQQRAREEEAFLASPQGQARLAAQAEGHIFQIALPLHSTERTLAGVISGDKTVKVTEGNHADVLSAIESEGWRLEHAGYVFQETGSVSRDKLLSSGQTAAVTGEIWGVYVFRRMTASKA